mmetsp:Transcript_1247/g.4729  ORF Transcript_1247/g.4729 Transcript_1247/m.4729 type:complete len:302 (-) Transcript_1247:753-1658(-)
MDSHSVVKVGLGRPQLHGDGKALHDLPGVRANVVETHDPLVLLLQGDELKKASVVLAVLDALLQVVKLLVGLPLQRPEVRVVDLELVLAVGLLGELLGHSDAPVLQRGEHGGGHFQVVHLVVWPAPKEPVGEPLAGLDGHGSQLLARVHGIPDGVDVPRARLVVLVHENLPGLGVELDASCLQVDVRAGGPPHGKEHGVKVLRGLELEVQVLVGAGNHAVVRVGLVLDLLKLDRDAPPNHLGAVPLHVRPDVLCDLLVEPPQEDGPRHDVGVVPEGREEPGALERDVARADHQGLPRRLLQ